MKAQCKHTNTKFIGIFHHTDYPEKCFICEDCNTLITDYLKQGDIETFTANQNLNLTL